MLASLPEAAAARRSDPRLNARWKALCAREFRHIYHESFEHGQPPMPSRSGQLRRQRPALKPSRLLPASLMEVCEEPLLTPAEEREFFARMNFERWQAANLRDALAEGRRTSAALHRLESMLAAADDLRNTILRANTRLVIALAGKFASPVHPLEDLVSEGLMTLMRAIDSFDFSRGFRFSTYATHAIRRSLYRHVQQKRSEAMRTPDAPDQLARHAASDDEGARLNEVQWEQLRAACARLVAQLDRREQEIISARFALGSASEPETLQSIADRMGVCKERVRQLERRALAKLRTLAEAAHETALTG